MSAGLTLCAVILLGLSWIVTGRDPLWWGIHGLIWLRAAIKSAFGMALVAGAAWWRRLPKAVEACRREVMEEP